VRSEQHYTATIFETFVQSVPVFGRDELDNDLICESRNLEKLDSRLPDVAKDIFDDGIYFIIGLGFAERHAKVLSGDSAVSTVENPGDVADNDTDAAGRGARKAPEYPHQSRRQASQ